MGLAVTHNFVYYLEENMKLQNILKIEEVEIPKNSVFFGYDYLQHAGPGWKGNHAMRYHMITEGANIKISISFTYGLLLGHKMSYLEKIGAKVRRMRNQK